MSLPCEGFTVRILHMLLSFRYRGTTTEHDMDIEGLKSKRTDSDQVSEVVYYPEDSSAYRCISLRVSPNGAHVELLEAGERPGIENGEYVPIVRYSPEIGERIVRAMAKLHFSLDEAANGYTRVDADFISRGFIVGTAQGVKPIWFQSIGAYFVVVGKTDEGGLPSAPDEPCCLVFGIPNGHRVIVKADDLPAAMALLDSGKLPQLLNPRSDVEIEGLRTSDGVTVH